MANTTGSNKNMNWSSATQEAIQHLRTVKPYDGWSVDVERLRFTGNPVGVRLLRRNVPVSEYYFMDLQYDRPSNTIVGLLSLTPSHGKVQGQVLVDFENGGVILDCQNEVKLIYVLRNMKTTNTTRRSKYSDGIMFGTFVYGICAIVLLRTVFSKTISMRIFVVGSVVYVLLHYRCPRDASFDVKKELKRVLREHNLPEPDKPKGFLSEKFERAAASVATKLATLPGGYEVTTHNVLHAAVVKSVRVPTANLQFYWIGIMNQWYYIYSSKITKPNQ